MKHNSLFDSKPPHISSSIIYDKLMDIEAKLLVIEDMLKRNPNNVSIDKSIINQYEAVRGDD